MKSGKLLIGTKDGGAHGNLGDSFIFSNFEEKKQNAYFLSFVEPCSHFLKVTKK